MALRALHPASRVLDAACGAGFDAAALAGRGMEVTATDANEAMVRATRDRLGAAGLVARVERARWAELGSLLDPGGFDAVLCCGGSLGHAGSSLDNLLATFCRLLTPGGVMITDSQHWEAVMATGDHVVVDPRPVQRNGATCRATYHWRASGSADSASVCEMDVVLEIEAANDTTVRSHSLHFSPFSTRRLLDATRGAGLVVETCDPRADHHRYSLVARKPAA